MDGAAYTVADDRPLSDQRSRKSINPFGRFFKRYLPRSLTREDLAGLLSRMIGHKIAEKHRRTFRSMAAFP